MDDLRRTSILKSALRFPILPDESNVDDDTVTNTFTRNRRVSFGKKQVKGFLVGSTVSERALYEYEQYQSSDSASSVLSESDCPLDLALNRTQPSKEPMNLTQPVAVQIRSAALPAENFAKDCINIAKSVMENSEMEMTAIIIGKKANNQENIDGSDGFVPSRKSQAELFSTGHNASAQEFNRSKFDFLNHSQGEPVEHVRQPLAPLNTVPIRPLITNHNLTRRGMDDEMEYTCNRNTPLPTEDDSYEVEDMDLTLTDDDSSPSDNEGGNDSPTLPLKHIKQFHFFPGFDNDNTQTCTNFNFFDVAPVENSITTNLTLGKPNFALFQDNLDVTETGQNMSVDMDISEVAPLNPIDSDINKIIDKLNPSESQYTFEKHPDVSPLRLISQGSSTMSTDSREGSTMSLDSVKKDSLKTNISNVLNNVDLDGSFNDSLTISKGKRLPLCLNKSVDTSFECTMTLDRNEIRKDVQLEVDLTQNLTVEEEKSQIIEGESHMKIKNTSIVQENESSEKLKLLMMEKRAHSDSPCMIEKSAKRWKESTTPRRSLLEKLNKSESQTSNIVPETAKNGIATIYESLDKVNASDMSLESTITLEKVGKHQKLEMSLTEHLQMEENSPVPQDQELSNTSRLIEESTALETLRPEEQIPDIGRIENSESILETISQALEVLNNETVSEINLLNAKEKEITLQPECISETVSQIPEVINNETVSESNLLNEKEKEITLQPECISETISKTPDVIDNETVSEINLLNEKAKEITLQPGCISEPVLQIQEVINNETVSEITLLNEKEKEITLQPECVSEPVFQTLEVINNETISVINISEKQKKEVILQPECISEPVFQTPEVINNETISVISISEKQEKEVILQPECISEPVLQTPEVINNETISVISISEKQEKEVILQPECISEPVLQTPEIINNETVSELNLLNEKEEEVIMQSECSLEPVSQTLEVINNETISAINSSEKQEKEVILPPEPVLETMSQTLVLITSEAIPQVNLLDKDKEKEPVSLTETSKESAEEYISKNLSQTVDNNLCPYNENHSDVLQTSNEEETNIQMEEVEQEQCVPSLQTQVDDECFHENNSKISEDESNSKIKNKSLMGESKSHEKATEQKLIEKRIHSDSPCVTEKSAKRLKESMTPKRSLSEKFEKSGSEMDNTTPGIAQSGVEFIEESVNRIHLTDTPLESSITMEQIEKRTEIEAHFTENIAMQESIQNSHAIYDSVESALKVLDEESVALDVSKKEYLLSQTKDMEEDEAISQQMAQTQEDESIPQTMTQVLEDESSGLYKEPIPVALNVSKKQDFNNVLTERECLPAQISQILEEESTMEIRNTSDMQEEGLYENIQFIENRNANSSCRFEKCTEETLAISMAVTPVRNVYLPEETLTTLSMTLIEGSVIPSIVLNVIKEQELEKDCTWSIENVNETSVAVSVSMLKSTLHVNFYLRTEKMHVSTTRNCSKVNEKDMNVGLLGLQRLDDFINEEAARLPNVKDLPILLDLINGFTKRLNEALKDVLKVATRHPAGRYTTPDTMLFKIISYPMSVLTDVIVDLRELPFLHSGCLTFKHKLKECDEQKVKDIFVKACKQSVNPLERFVYILDEWLESEEAPTGRITKRSRPFI